MPTPLTPISSFGLPADARDTGSAHRSWSILVRSMRLLTNNPAKRVGLMQMIAIIERVPLPVVGQRENIVTWMTKLRQIK